MKVSVAICTYNGARFIEEQLHSILTQSRIPDEIVLRDDGSTDGTISLARAILESSGIPADIRANEARLGVARNFEGAIRACTGDVVFLSDQDDVWGRDKVAAMLGILEANPQVSWLFSDAACIDGDGNPKAARLWSTFGLDARVVARIGRGEGFKDLLRTPLVTGATMAFRTSAIRKALPICNGWVHDQWIALMLSFLGERAASVDRPLISYRIHDFQEIGVREAESSYRWKRSLATGASQYLAAVKELEAFLHEAEARARSTGASDWQARSRLVHRNIAHFRARARMRKAARPAALWLILWELTTGRYRFSYSRLAIAKDLAELLKLDRRDRLVG